MTGCPRGFSSQNQWVFKDTNQFKAANNLIAQIKVILDSFQYTQ